ncbi:MAG: glutathione S-transferase family protein [Bacteriovorax sp.]|nr:glutathione S-transferase family protein [Bacteriovorax sp.]
MIKLYGYGPTRWSKCIWMASELGITLEEENVQYTGDGFGDENYRKIHPFGLVPALQDGDFTLFESQAIINYLGEKFPEKSLVPKSGTYERALYDQWTYFCTATLEFPLTSWFRHSFIFDEKTKNQVEIDRASEELKKQLIILNSVLENKSFLVGNRFTAADISMTYTLNWATGFGFLEGNNNLKNYTETHLKRDAFPKHLYE